MIGPDGQLGREVLNLVDSWIPSQKYDHERKFQSELQEYLDQELNSSSGPFDQGSSHVVSTERGTSYGDVVVDDKIGIELKRNFSNSQKKKLRGQLEDYADNYDLVIACACGIEDMDGWRELEKKFQNRRGVGLDVTQFEFIFKQREDFGKSQGGGGSGGLFGGGDGLL